MTDADSQVSVESGEGYACIRLSGEFDEALVAAAQEALSALLESREPLLVDAASVSRVGPKSEESLVPFQTRIARAGLRSAWVSRRASHRGMLRRVVVQAGDDNAFVCMRMAAAAEWLRMTEDRGERLMRETVNSLRSVEARMRRLRGET